MDYNYAEPQTGTAWYLKYPCYWKAREARPMPWFAMDNDAEGVFILKTFNNDTGSEKYIETYYETVSDQLRESKEICSNFSRKMGDWSGITVFAYHEESKLFWYYYLLHKPYYVLIAFLASPEKVSNSTLLEFENTIHSIQLVSPIIEPLTPDKKKVSFCSSTGNYWNIYLPNNIPVYQTEERHFYFMLEENEIYLFGTLAPKGVYVTDQFINKAYALLANDLSLKTDAYKKIELGSWKGIKAQELNKYLWIIYKEKYYFIIHCDSDEYPLSNSDIETIESVIVTLEPAVEKNVLAKIAPQK